MTDSATPKVTDEVVRVARMAWHSHEWHAYPSMNASLDAAMRAALAAALAVMPRDDRLREAAERVVLSIDRAELRADWTRLTNARLRGRERVTVKTALALRYLEALRRALAEPAEPPRAPGWYHARRKGEAGWPMKAYLDERDEWRVISPIGVAAIDLGNRFGPRDFEIGQRIPEPGE